MPEYFLTKTWGFGPATHPVLGISEYGARKTFLQSSKPGDWVIIAGTAQPPTHVDDHGRLLGVVRLGRNEVDTESVLNHLGTPIQNSDRDAHGRYRWPYALPMLEAYRFTEKPTISSVFGDGLSGFVWVKNIRSISNASRPLNELISAIEQLPKERVEIAPIPEFNRLRYRERLLALGRTGPGPSRSRSASITTHGFPVTYCLKMTGTGRNDVFKIGYTNNLDIRHAELRRGLVTAITGFSWEQHIVQPQESGISAYVCEQLVHKTLAKYRVEGEQEIYKVTEREMMSVWNNIIAEADRFMSPEAQAEYAPKYDALLAADREISESEAV